MHKFFLHAFPVGDMAQRCWHLMTLQFSEITQSRVFDGAKLESEALFPLILSHFIGIWKRKWFGGSSYISDIFW